MNKNQAVNRRFEQGFSYIEVMIALVILLVGVLGMTSALSANLLRALETEKRIAAKQLALSTIESIISARDISRQGSVSGWNTIGSVQTNPDENGVFQGIFLTGFNPVREDLGWDGVAGTADDACAGNGVCTVNGRVNNSRIIPGFQRQIIITDVPDPERPTPPFAIFRRSVTVNVRYEMNGLTRNVTVSTLLTNY